MDEFLDWFLKYKLLGAPLPDLAKFTGFILAGFILGRILRYPVARWLKRITPESEHAIGDKVGRGIEKSVSLLIFTIVMKTGAIDVLHLPGWAWEKCGYAVTVLMAIASTMLFLQTVEVGLFGLRKRWQANQNQVDDHLINFMRKGIRVFVIIVAALVTADNIGFKVTGAIAGLGIGGAAIALASQGLIANLLGTIEIVADRLFRVGDRIHFDAFDGFVTDIGLRSTRIRALTGEIVTIPNRRMAEAQIRNFSRNGLVRTTMAVGVVYSTGHDEVRKAMQVLEEIFKARKDVDSHQIYLRQLGTSSLELEVIFWARYSTSHEYNDLIGQIHLEVKRRFDESKIEFAFPTQTLHIAQPPKA